VRAVRTRPRSLTEAPVMSAAVQGQQVAFSLPFEVGAYGVIQQHLVLGREQLVR
jgi:hypothetical protein